MSLKNNFVMWTIWLVGLHLLFHNQLKNQELSPEPQVYGYMYDQKNTPMTVGSLIFKSSATRFIRVFSRSWISSAMLWFEIVNPTDIFVLVR